MNNHQLTIQLQSSLSLAARDKISERLLAVSVTAPQAAERKERMPLNLALVLDRSGSMSGGKLEAVKQAALHVLDRLEARDRVAIVTYDDTIQLLAPSTQLTDTNRNRLKALIQPLRTGGSTALHDGWLSGCREVALHQNSDNISRCLLLTDGLANVGVTDPEQIAVEARNLSAKGVSTSTFGVGAGFDEHLLEAMSNAGSGRFYFIASPAAIPRIFEQEFGDLEDVTAAEVEVNLDLGHTSLVKVLGNWQTECPAEGQVRILLGSLSSGRERVVYLKLAVPAAAGNDAVETAVQATVRARGKDAGLLEAHTGFAWRYSSQADADAESPDRDFMQRYAPIQLGEDANEALKLERQGRRKEAEGLLKRTLQNTAGFIDEERAAYYRDMSGRMAAGMDEVDRKQSHHQSYMDKQNRIPGEHFRLERPSGHVVIDVRGVKVLLDTGSPISIGRQADWTFLGEPVNLLPEFAGVTVEYLTGQVGARVDVLLGMDVLKQYHLFIDTREQRVFFNRDSFFVRHSVQIPLTEYLMAVPGIQASINGRPLNLALDTGACISYLPDALLQGYPPAGTRHDFYPGYGEFDTPTFKVELELGGESYTAVCGILPALLMTALKATGMDGLLGMDLLDTFQLNLALPDKMLHLTRLPHIRQGA